MRLRSSLFLTFLILHLASCAAFLILRKPGISFLAERERDRNELGYIFLTSVDPIMYLAERPLFQWNEWHGGEELWVKILEVINLPALILTATIGSALIGLYRIAGFGDYAGDTWIRAYIFLAFSIGQWWLYAHIIERVVQRRKRRIKATAN